MQPPTPPKVTAVEIVAAQPSELDKATLAHLTTDTETPSPQVAYVVKVKLKAKLPVTSMTWMLYVDDVRIPKYWEYEEGIYFTVVDPQFFSDHKGKPLRFSMDETEFYDTGVKLTAPPALAKSKSKSKGKPARLPLQADVLK